jgi:hypothetical protein
MTAELLNSSMKFLSAQRRYGASLGTESTGALFQVQQNDFGRGVHPFRRERGAAAAADVQVRIVGS